MDEHRNNVGDGAQVTHPEQEALSVSDKWFRDTHIPDQGRCRVPMWMGGLPAGFCGEPANGGQLPREVLYLERGWQRGDAPYCHGPCCPNHGGPRDGEPILFQDGWTPEGRQMWCAVMPDFEDLQASPAGFSGNGNKAIANLKAALRAASEASQ